jgi:hypothetical protein
VTYAYFRGLYVPRGERWNTTLERKHTMELPMDQQPSVIPAPQFSEQWYRESSSKNPMAVYDDAGVSVTGPDAWHTTVGCADEFLSTGGWPCLFSTATGCLFWIRWVVGPQQYSGADLESDEFDKELREALEIVDAAGPGADAVDLLRRVCPLISADFTSTDQDDEGEFSDRGQRAYAFEAVSIHEYLSERIDVSTVRYIFSDPTIDCVDGRWILNEAQWKAVGVAYLENHNNGFENDDPSLDETIKLLVLQQKNALSWQDALDVISEVYSEDDVEERILEALKSGILTAEYLQGEVWRRNFDGKNSWIVGQGAQFDSFVEALEQS